MNNVILPPATIGIIGGGQLGRMIALSAKQMGYKIAVLEPGLGGPTAQVADLEINGYYDDEVALRSLLSRCAVTTYEFENISYITVEKLSADGYLPQGHRPIALTQHRLTEKKAIIKCGFKTAPFASVRNNVELQEALELIGYPSILKTISGGYDGKGQWAINSSDDLKNARAVIQNHACILEGYVNFAKEISVIVTRGVTGEIEAFPPIENIHQNHILSLSIAPARIDKRLAMQAETTARKLIERLDFIGTLAIEMFVVEGGLIINELAPRPHNSGHLTIDACNISQFEQHVRAICGLPLIKPILKTPATMVNLLGQQVEKAIDKWQTPEFAMAKLHLYGKEELKRDRKVGHITFMDQDCNQLDKTVTKFLQSKH